MTIRVALVSEVGFHRVALSRALSDILGLSVLGAVSDAAAVFELLARDEPDVLVVDSPSNTLLASLSTRQFSCPVVHLGVDAANRPPTLPSTDTVLDRRASLEEVYAAIQHVTRQRDTSRITRPAVHAELTNREREVLQWVARGCSNKEIAEGCSISTATVKHHVHHILTKLKLNSRSQIIRTAVDGGQSAPPASQAAPRNTERTQSSIEELGAVARAGKAADGVVESSSA